MRKALLRYDVIIVVAMFAIALVAQRGEWFSALEDETVSIRHLLRDVPFPDNITFVNTDEAFFAEYGSWPLRRTDIARIVENLHTLGARVVAVDLLFDFASSYGEDPDTAAAFERSGKVLVVSQGVVDDGQLLRINYPVEPIRSVTRSGYTNIESASAIIQRMSRIHVFAEGASMTDGYPFSAQALALYEDVVPQLDGDVLRIGDTDVELHNGGFLIDFPARGAHSWPETRGMSALDLLDLSRLDAAELDEMRDFFADRIVLIGDTSEVSHDYFATPVGTLYGVEIIAASIDTLQRGAPLRPASFALELLIALAAMACVLATAAIIRPLPRMAAAVAPMLVWLATCVALYLGRDVVLSMSYVAIASFVGFMAVNLRFYLQERGQKALIRDAFGQYLSPKVVNILVKDPTKLSLGGERREMTAFFSDIAGFSTISEHLTPEQLVALLNEYLTGMCDIIAKYDGTVDKFEGDAIIAFWGAPLPQPDHARLACMAAIDMQRYMVEYRQRLVSAGKPLLHIRIGMNTGPMLVGNLGSRQRMDYTIMGDAVNLAARLEGVNKEYGTRTMVSENTYAQVRDMVEVRELDRIRVIGRREPVTIYELLERKGELRGSQAEAVTAYMKGLSLYRGRDFGAAMRAFQDVLKIDATDGPSKTYIQRCEEYLQAPPGDGWDGVFQMNTK